LSTGKKNRELSQNESSFFWSRQSEAIFKMR